MEEITLNDGRKVTKRKVKVRDLANAEAQAKGKDHLIKYAIMGAKILINDKPAVLEDILDMDEDDLVKVGELFEDDSPNV
jgi:hypothetical protein